MMTKRDFFIVLIRVFGSFFASKHFLWCCTEFTCPIHVQRLIVVLCLYGAHYTSPYLVVIFVLLLQHTGRVVDRLKLAKGYDDDRIELGNPNKVMLIRLAILFGGTYLIVDRLPFALLGIFAIFRKN
jgi:hypothetical protein